MIRPLRKTHRALFALLALLLPLAFALGIAARRPVPTVPSLPEELAQAAPLVGAVEWERDDLFGQLPVNVRLFREAGDAGRYSVALHAEANFLKPDLIVYWVAGNPAITDTIPDDALLLGSFSAPALTLPAELLSPTSNGVLVLFSLADQEVVAVSKAFVATNASSRQPSAPRTDSEVGRRLTSAATEN